MRLYRPAVLLEGAGGHHPKDGVDPDRTFKGSHRSSHAFFGGRSEWESGPGPGADILGAMNGPAELFLIAGDLLKPLRIEKRKGRQLAFAGKDAVPAGQAAEAGVICRMGPDAVPLHDRPDFFLRPVKDRA